MGELGGGGDVDFDWAMVLSCETSAPGQVGQTHGFLSEGRG